MTAVLSSWLKSLRDAGSLAHEYPWWGWIDARTILTLQGEVLTLASLDCLPVAGRSPAQLAGDVEGWMRLCGQLPAACRLSLHAMRRRCPVQAPPNGARFPAAAWLRREAQVADRCGDIQVVLGWCLDAGLGRRSSSGGVLSRFRGGGGSGDLEFAAIEAAGARLQQLVDTQLGLCGAWRPRLLGPAEGTAALAELANRPGTPAPGPGRPGTLAWRLALSDVEAHARHLTVGGDPVALFSISEPPPAAAANALRGLSEIDGAWTLHWEWRRLTTAGARKRIDSARRHFFSRRYGVVAHMQDKEGTAAAMEDSAAATEAARLGEALVEVESDGIAYGDLSCGIALHGQDLERRAADVLSIFAAADAKIIRESYGQLATWFARLPGQPAARQVRTVMVSSGVAGCLAPLWGDPDGHKSCAHLRAAPLALFETPTRRPYRYDLFNGGDVGHTLVLGATGSGKSFLLNFLLVNAQRYRPRVCVLDLGGGYRSLSSTLGGSYLSLDPAADGGGATVRPLSLPRERASLQFLAAWVAGLLQAGGYIATGDDVTDIRSRIEEVYDLPVERRSLGRLAEVLKPRMRPAMSRWVGDGSWGAVFDPPGGAGAGEDLGADFQVVDISGAAQHPDLAGAALGYYLERLRIEIERPDELSRLKLMVVDEAWKFISDARVGTYLAEAAKTWRKRNAALILASQSAGDILRAASAGQILESLPHRIYLANPDLPDEVAEPLKLTAAELRTIRGLAPKRELYLQTRGGNALLRLQVSSREYWMYTSDPNDVARRVEAERRLGGLDAALDELAGPG